MERVFKEDIMARGYLRYTAGEIKDYPKATWIGLAEGLGRNLGDFTFSKEEAASLSVQAFEIPKSAESVPDSDPPRRRLKERN